MLLNNEFIQKCIQIISIENIKFKLIYLTALYGIDRFYLELKLIITTISRFIKVFLQFECRYTHFFQRNPIFVKMY